MYPQNGQQYSLTARGSSGAATCKTLPLDTSQTASAGTPSSQTAAAASAPAANISAQASAANAPSAEAGTASTPAAPPTAAVAGTGDRAATASARESRHGREVAAESAAPQVELTQVPYTGIDDDIAMPFLGFAVMIIISSLVVTGIYFLNRRDAIPLLG